MGNTESGPATTSDAHRDTLPLAGGSSVIPGSLRSPSAMISMMVSRDGTSSGGSKKKSATGGGLLSASSTSRRTKPQSKNTTARTTTATPRAPVDATPRIANKSKSGHGSKITFDKDNNNNKYVTKSEPQQQQRRRSTTNNEDVRQPAESQNDRRISFSSQVNKREGPALSVTFSSYDDIHHRRRSGDGSGGSRYDPIHLSEGDEEIYVANGDNKKSFEGDNKKVDSLLKKISALSGDVLEASAAVFLYLENQENGSNNTKDKIIVVDDEDDGGNSEDNSRTSCRSHAVLTYVENEAWKGNTTYAYKLLETAKAVKEVLDEDDDEDGNEEGGYQIRTTKPIPSRTATATVFQSPVTKTHSNDNCHVNDNKENDNVSISEQSMEIFKILDSMESCDDNDDGTRGGGGFKLRSILRKGRQQRQRQEGQSMRGNGVRLLSQDDPPINSGGVGTSVKFVDDNCGERYLPDIPEMKSTAEESDSGDEGLVSKDSDSVSGNNYRTIHHIVLKKEGRNGEGVDLTDLPHLHAIDDSNIDIEFVKNFDVAFDEFIAQQPGFVDMFPDLIHHLRTAKLQKFLEYCELNERNSMAKLTKLQREKSSMEQNMHLQLQNAARKKAARQTFLQSELDNLRWSTKNIQSQLRWKFVQYSVDRAKRQFKLRQQFEMVPHVENLRELMDLVPNNQHGKAIRDAVGSAQNDEVDKDRDSRSVAHFVGDSKRFAQEEDKRQIRVYQMKNKALNDELTLLNKRLAYLQKEAKKFKSVESALLDMDEATMIRLKKRFQKKEGV